MRFLFANAVQVPFLQSTINDVVNADTEDALNSVLDKFDPPHHFERPEERNLINWYKVLNRFDFLLERYVSERNIFAKSAEQSPVDQTMVGDPSKQASIASSKLGSSPHAARPPESPSVRDTSSRTSGRPPFRSDSSGSGVQGDGALLGQDLQTQTDRVEASNKMVFTPSPKLILRILRTSQRLVRNASHDTRHVYNSVEHITALLADDNSAIILLTLEILNLLLQRSHKFRATRIAVTFELTDRLLDLAAGWGGRENGLGMVECCSKNNMDSLSPEGRKVYFKFTKGSPGSPGRSSIADAISRDRRPLLHNLAERKSIANSSRISNPSPLPLAVSSGFSYVPPTNEPVVSTKGSAGTILVEDAGAFQGTERWLLSDFAPKHGVPNNKLFSLLTAFRRAKRFCEGRDGRVEATILRLYAITTLLYLQPLPVSLHELLGKEPELLQDVVNLAKSETRDGLEDIPRSLRNIALRCLTAMSSDRHRVASIVSATGVNVHHGALPTLLRSEIGALLSSSFVEDDASMELASDNDETLVHDEYDGNEASTGAANDVARAMARRFARLSLLTECNRMSVATQRIQTTESLLALVHSLAIAGSSAGAAPLANSGVLGILVPLLKNRDARHSRVVAQAIRAMQAIVDGSPASLGNQLFRDHSGLSLTADRIAMEVGISADVNEAEQDAEDENAEADALRRRGESRALYERLGRRQMTPEEALQHQPPSSSTASRGLLPHSRWALLRALHQLLLAALGTGGSEVRQLVVGSKLPQALRRILAQPFLHGGSLFQSAATVTTDIAHAEPTATSELVKAGLASTVLKSIRLGLPPCGEAIRCIPNLLAALCLAPSARDIIVSSRPLKQYLLRLATPFYTRALHGEIPIHIGSALDELMRHVEALRPRGNEAMIEYLQMSAEFVITETRTCGVSQRSPDDPKVSAETERNEPLVLREKPSHLHSVPEGDGEKVAPNEILLDKMKLAVANNSCRLAGFAQGSSEHQQGIVEGGGLEHMISVRIAPALAAPEASVRDGYTFSRHYPTPAMTIVSLVTSLRNFSSRHGTAVLNSLFSKIVKDAATVLRIAKQLNDEWLPEEEGGTDLTHDVSKAEKAMTHLSAEDEENLRVSLGQALRKLKLGVVLLTGLSRGGPGSSTGAWDSAGGPQVAAIISTVERAARYHLAVVYTGLTLSASSDGDLTTARVTAAADPVMKPLQPERTMRSMSDIEKAIGVPITKMKAFAESCKSYKVPPEGQDLSRQDVKGLAWHLVTFAVASQRLYSTLARGMSFGSRRSSRDRARHAVRAKSLANTIGRIFALHLKAAAPLWDIKVKTMGKKQIIAAWDYVRGVLIEIKGTLFDDHRRTTQSLLLKSFLDAGGSRALVESTKALSIVRAAGKISRDERGEQGERGEREQVFEADVGIAQLDDLMSSRSLSLTSLMLALGDTLAKAGTLQAAEGLQQNDPSAGVESGKNSGDREDIVMSSDSVSHQARGIARIMVSDVKLRGESSPSDSNIAFRSLLSNKDGLDKLRQQTQQACEAALERCSDVAIRRVASDVWNTLCGFLQMLASCPGLVGPNPPASLVPLPGEWAPRDLHRSALSIALGILGDVTDNASDLIAAFRPDATAMNDILSILHSASEASNNLTKKSKTPGPQAPPPEGGRPLLEPPTESPPARPLSPDPDMLQSLVEMGFPERRARTALRRTAVAGIEYAMEWLLANPDNDDDSSGGSEDGREWRAESQDQNPDGEEGGSNTGNVEEDADDEVSNDPEEAAATLEQVGTASGSASDGLETENRGDDDAMVDGPEVTGEDSDVVPPASSSNPVLVAGDKGEKESKSGEQCSSSGTSAKTISEKQAVESQSNGLLDRAAANEIGLLLQALEKSDLRDEEVSGLRRLAGIRIGITTTDGRAVTPRGGEDSLCVSPVSEETFTERKRDIFYSLVNLVQEIIRREGNHIHGTHLPYIAIELLTVMQKDRTLKESHSAMFAKLLNEGLQSALDKHLGLKDVPKQNSTGPTAAIWAHYGGSQARKALETCGAFQLAYSCLSNAIVEWERCGKTPFVDLDATKPIEKLTITEGKTRMDDDGHSADIANVLQVESSPGKNELRAPSRQEAMLLRQMTTCTLLLDAYVRYRAKDKIVQQAREFSASRRKEQKTQEERQEELDAKVKEKEENEYRGANPDRFLASDREGSSHMPFEDYVRSMIERTAVMGGDANAWEEALAKSRNCKKRDPENEDLHVAREGAVEEKKKILGCAIRSIRDLVSTETTESDMCAVSERGILMLCLRLLRVWKFVEVGDALLAVLQTLAALTRRWDLAKEAVGNNAVNLLLTMPYIDGKDVRSTDCRIVRQTTRTILRHMIEDPETLREAMESEIRSLVSGQPRRFNFNSEDETLISSTAPLIARDLHTYILAVAEAAPHTSGFFSGQTSSKAFKTWGTVEMEEKVKARPNVSEVVSGLCQLLVTKRCRERSSLHSGISLEACSIVSKGPQMQVARYALDTLSELVEVAQVAAAAFLRTPSPSPEVKGSALDYVVQAMLPHTGVRGGGIGISPISSVHPSSEAEGLAHSAKKLFLALCSKSANAHEEAVAALALAASLEVDKNDLNPSMIQGIASCIAPGTKLRVLRAVLRTKLANDLARSLRVVGRTAEPNFDVTVTVLRALGLIGQAATHIARYGDNAGEDVSLGNNGRDPWISLRERDDAISPSYMVL